MPRPTGDYASAILADFASDALFAGGTEEDGLTTKEVAGSALRKQGFQPGFNFRSAHVNSQIHGLGLWADYLSGLATDSEFRADLIGSLFSPTLAADATFKASLGAEAFAWTAQHGFNLAPIFASGIALSGTGEALYTNIAGTPTRRSRTIPIDLSRFQLHGAFENYTSTAGIIQNAGADTNTDDYAVARFHPPAGSRVTQIRALVEHVSGPVSPSGDAAAMATHHVAPDKVAAYGASTVTSLGTAQAGAASGFHLLTINVAGGQEIDTNGEIRVAINAAWSTSATRIHWADYTADIAGAWVY